MHQKRDLEAQSKLLPVFPTELMSGTKMKEMKPQTTIKSSQMWLRLWKKKEKQEILQIVEGSFAWITQQWKQQQSIRVHHAGPLLVSFPACVSMPHSHSCGIFLLVQRSS
jgi:hypothetical protein